MRFSSEAERFLRPGCDRLLALSSILAARSLAPFVVRTGQARHLVVRLGKERPVLAFAAHYDRVEGSPGVLDNSCACLQLVELAARQAGTESPSFLLIFTDAEERSGAGGPAGQGSFALARALIGSLRRREAGAAPRSARTPLPPVFVLDVTGRGDRLLLSSSPSELLERNGLSASPASRDHGRLTRLALAAAARAKHAAPLVRPLPWSDDLGLVLGGLGALTISLLPSREASILAAGGRPATWEHLHGPDDAENLAEEGAFKLIGTFLDAALAELPSF
jgi:hypothetical protein